MPVVFTIACEWYPGQGQFDAGHEDHFMKRATARPELLLRLSGRRGVSRRRELERELRALIQTGGLRAGDRLPSTRNLAGDLGVSRGLVVEAYDQLLAEGYVTARRGSATRVAGRRPAAPVSRVVEPRATSLRYDFRPGVPDASMFPRRAWLASLRRTLAMAPDAALGYPAPRGAEAVHAALAAYLNRARGAVASAECVVMCAGFTQGLRLVCHVLRERGVTRMAIEDPSHAEQRSLISVAGLRPVPVAVDADGLEVDRLARADVGAVLITPAHQFPTGAVLAPSRRAALLDWALRRGAFIVEDDYDAEYRYDREPVAAVQGLAPDRVIYAGSASKTLAPALRLGWLVLPPELVADVAAAKRRDDLGSPTLAQLAYADFVERGELDRHLRRMRLFYRRRRDALVAALDFRLPALRIHGVAAGLHLMVELDEDADERAVIAAAAGRSVGVYGVAIHRARPAGHPPALVLGYAAMPETAIAEGIDRLAKAIEATRPAGA